MSLHPDFLTASWRGTTNTDGKVIGVSFDLDDGSVVRLKLDFHSARQLAESILEFLEPYLGDMNSHSESAEGKPKDAVSMPEECAKV